MPNNGSTGFEKYEEAAALTIKLIDHSHTPDAISDSILETIIQISDENLVKIWHEKNGLSVSSLAALFSLYKTGAGYRRVRLYGAYEAGRNRRRR
jgi:hypothetical protein